MNNLGNSHIVKSDNANMLGFATGKDKSINLDKSSFSGFGAVFDFIDMSKIGLEDEAGLNEQHISKILERPKYEEKAINTTTVKPTDNVDENRNNEVKQEEQVAVKDIEQRKPRKVKPEEFVIEMAVLTNFDNEDMKEFLNKLKDVGEKLGLSEDVMKVFDSDADDITKIMEFFSAFFKGELKAIDKLTKDNALDLLDKLPSKDLLDRLSKSLDKIAANLEGNENADEMDVTLLNKFRELAQRASKLREVFETVSQGAKLTTDQENLLKRFLYEAGFTKLVNKELHKQLNLKEDAQHWGKEFSAKLAKFNIDNIGSNQKSNTLMGIKFNLIDKSSIVNELSSNKLEIKKLNVEATRNLLLDDGEGENNQLRNFAEKITHKDFARMMDKTVNNVKSRLSNHVFQSLAGSVYRNINKGINEFKFRLNPPELGNIDVKMTINKDNFVKINIVVKSSDVLEYFEKDAKSLEEALNNNGLQMEENSLSFSLNQEDSSPWSQEEDAKHSALHDAIEEDDELHEDLEDAIEQNVLIASSVLSDRLLDVMI